MKRRILSILTALALCLGLLPGTAWALGTGVTITGTSGNEVTLDTEKLYVADETNGGVKPVEDGETPTDYLSCDGNTLTVNGAVELTGMVTITSDLKITGEEDSSLSVTNSSAPPIWLQNGSTLTLSGGVDFTGESSVTPVVNGSGSTFAAAPDYSGNIVLTSTGRSPAVFHTALDVESSASITITGIIDRYPETPGTAVLKSSGEVSLTFDTALEIPSLTVEGENVSLTKTNSSDRVYNGDLLTIEATGDVRITNTGDGACAPAISGVANISAKGNVTISSDSVPIESETTLTVQNARSVSFTGNSDKYYAFFSGPVTFEDCGEVTVMDTGGTQPFLKEGIALTSDVPIRVAKNREEKLYTDGKIWAYDSTDITNTILGSLPDDPTAYKAGEGWVFYEPQEGAPAKLILDNAQCPNGGFFLGDSVPAVSVEVKGENYISLIEVRGSVTVTETNGTLNALVCEDKSGEGEYDYDYRVYGEVELGGGILVGRDDDPDGPVSSSLTIPQGAKLTIPSDAGLIISDTAYLNNQGALVNNGTVILAEDAAKDADAETVKGLGLTGSGSVKVVTTDEDDNTVTTTYTNSGTKQLTPAGTDGTLDLSSAAAVDKLSEQGYKWEVTKDATSGDVTSATLTLAEGFNADELKLPVTGAIEIVTQGEASVKTLAFGSDSPNVQLTFSGKGPLIFQNPMNISGGDNNSLTVEAGAEVVANGGISIGASGGVNSTVTVNGKLTANGGSGTAIYGGKVAVGDTGVLEVSGEYGVTLNGMPQLDAEAYKDLFTVTGDGRFTADCTDYNVQVAPSGSFPEGTTAEGAINLGPEYMPDDCKAVLKDGVINLVRISTGEVYSGPLTIHKNHTWETGWTWDGTNHWHACEFAGCTEKQPGSEAAHFYRSCVCTVCSYQAPAGTPDSNSGGVGGGGVGGSVHTHVWETEWTTSETHHWHECTAEGCDITADSDKGDYGAHVYDSDQDAECNTCGYRRTVTPPTPSQPSQPSGGGSSVSTTYAITVEKSEHGKVTSSRTNASSGSTVTLTVTPDGGYVLDTLTVTDSRGSEIRLTAQGGGKYAFTMPGRAVTVKAAFSPLPDDGTKPCDGGADCPSRAFPDLDTGSWYHEAVDYVLRSGLMNGYGSGLFGPNDMLTRAQFAQVLFNKEGRPVVNYLLQYSDTAAGAWYAGAVRWATSQGIVCGYGNGAFGPDDPITREQLAVMLWRYAGSPAATDKELHFNDADEISGWALEALRWAVEKGIISGKGGGVLDPAGTATRAETAQMLKNFLESM